MQTKRKSVAEVMTNTFTGMIGSWLITMACVYAIEDRTVAATVTVVACTVWSLARGYAIRRMFNGLEVPDA